MNVAKNVRGEREVQRKTTGARIPRWPFFIAVMLIGALMSALSENVTIGPSWLTLAIVTASIIPLLIAVVMEHHQWIRRVSFTIIFIMTVALLSSVIFLVHSLFTHSTSAIVLFEDALVLWSANVVVFATWYWEVDQGGPTHRHTHLTKPTDLLFPQATLDNEEWKDWRPTFVDYVFLSFNTSTAFSPTDTLVLSRRVKVLMMTQSSISLVIVAVLAARAINIA